MKSVHSKALSWIVQETGIQLCYVFVLQYTGKLHSLKIFKERVLFPPTSYV